MNVDVAMLSHSRWIIRYRWLLLGAIALITFGLLYSTQYLVVNNDYDNWLPANDKVSELYRLVDKHFSSTALLFTVLDFSENGVFDPDSLALVQRMTDALEGIDELFNVSSLTNIVDIRKADFGAEVGDLIPEIPESAEELDALKQYVLSKEMYIDALISHDAAYTVLVANIDGAWDEIVTAKKVLKTIHEVAGGHPYYFGGDPALIVYADLYMNKDLTLLIPVVMVLMVLILAFSFRRFWGVVLPLSFVILGLMCGTQVPLDFGTALFGALIVGLGVDGSIHFMHHNHDRQCHHLLRLPRAAVFKHLGTSQLRHRKFPGHLPGDGFSDDLPACAHNPLARGQRQKSGIGGQGSEGERVKAKGDVTGRGT